MQAEALDEWTIPIPSQHGDGSDVINKITKLLESHTMAFGGYYETFNKATDLIYFALSGREEDYMKLVQSLDKSAVNAVAQISHMLINAFCVEYRYDNYLGVVYERMSRNNPAMGQFFTPWNVAYMMAKMTLGDVKAQIATARAENKRITINDPAVGSGVMLLAMKRVIIEEAGLKGLDYFEFSGTDLDPLCVKMCKIHMMLTDYKYMTSRLLVALCDAGYIKHHPNKDDIISSG